MSKHTCHLLDAAGNRGTRQQLYTLSMAEKVPTASEVPDLQQVVAGDSLDADSYSPPILHQQVGGTLDTPATTEAMPRRVGQAFTGLSEPQGLAITREGHIVVVEGGKHCITIVDPNNGRKIRSFGKRGSKRVQFNDPRGVAVTQDGRIVVAEWSNHRLQVLTAEGAFIATVGSKGSQPLQFQYPWDIAVHQNGQIFVSDGDNHRVQVLNADLSYSHCIGSEEGYDGLTFPKGVTFDSDGTVYVADCSNDRVQKFTHEGKPMNIIYGTGKRGLLDAPWGLHIDGNNILYVIEREIKRIVSRFTSKGRFLGYVGDSDGSSFKSPWFIISDQTGRLYISDDKKVLTYHQQ